PRPHWSPPRPTWRRRRPRQREAKRADRREPKLPQPPPRRRRSRRQLALDGIDAHAALLAVGEAAVDVLELAVDLEHHPALIAGDVGAPDVGDHREAMAELVDDGLTDQVGAEAQLDAAPSHRAALSRRRRP